MIRIGFWGYIYTIVTIRNLQNSVGNYLDPYIRALGFWVSGSFIQGVGGKVLVERLLGCRVPVLVSSKLCLIEKDQEQSLI